MKIKEVENRVNGQVLPENILLSEIKSFWDWPFPLKRKKAPSIPDLFGDRFSSIKVFRILAK
ncbi:MAG TPA: hypothetical protein VGC97_16655 [Pyrinomonadaceae bacterium]|jgi:hypothetical protein